MPRKTLEYAGRDYKRERASMRPRPDAAENDGGPDCWHFIHPEELQ